MGCVSRFAGGCFVIKGCSLAICSSFCPLFLVVRRCYVRQVFGFAPRSSPRTPAERSPARTVSRCVDRGSPTGPGYLPRELSGVVIEVASFEVGTLPQSRLD